MTSGQRANTPLWFDLLLMTGMVGVAYSVHRYARPQPLSKSGRATSDHTARDKSSPYGDLRDGDGAAAVVDTDEGAMNRRPSQEPLSLQRRRGTEDERGRHADQPHQIPAKGWMDVGWRVYNQIQDNRVLAVAGGVVFYAILALFPALAALVSLYGLFTDPSVIASQLSLLEGILPESTITIIGGQVTQLAQTSSPALSFGFLFGLALALWSANSGMKAIIDALNVVYDEREKRSFIWLTLVAFAFTIGALMFIILAIAAIVILPLVFAWVGLESRAGQIISMARWPALFIVTLLWLAVLYRYGPSRTRARWQWLSVGSFVAAVLWLGISALFSWYLGNFANYDATYGSLGASIGMMMWLWLSVIAVLVGGELNAELEHQTARDTTVRPDKPLGRRGAVMADTVGEAWR